MIEQKFAPVERTTLTIFEVATYLGVSKELLYKKVREKRIPHFKIGSRILFKRDSIDRWMSEKEVEYGGK